MADSLGIKSMRRNDMMIENKLLISPKI